MLAPLISFGLVALVRLLVLVEGTDPGIDIQTQLLAVSATGPLVVGIVALSLLAPTLVRVVRRLPGVEIRPHEVVLRLGTPNTIRIDAERRGWGVTAPAPQEGLRQLLHGAGHAFTVGPHGRGPTIHECHLGDDLDLVRLHAVIVAVLEGREVDS